MLTMTALPAQATDQADSRLEIVQVIAAREPGNLLLNSDQLDRIQASTIEDMFANESSVAVGGGSATAQKIYVRGFEDVMLNVTIDGAQSPGELYHHQGRVQLEPEFVKAIELDAGAGVATNGAGALTGALKVTLKDAFDMLEPGEDWGALVKGTGKFNGDNGEKYTTALYGKLTNNIGFIGGYTHENRNDYDDGNGDVVAPSSYDHARSFAKLNGSFDRQTFSLTFEDIDDEATTFERPNLTNYRGTFQYSDQQMSRQTAAFNYRYNAENDWLDVQTTLYTNQSDFKVQRQNADIIYGEGQFDSIGFDLRNSTVIGKQNLTYGIDYRSDELKSAQNATPPFAWGDTEQSAEVIGVYLQDNWAITQAINFTAGLRYDDYSFDGDGGISDGVNISDSGISPNIGLSWEVAEGLVLRTAYAQAFRGVTIREAFFSGLYLHDGSLESEEADNLELGISYENGGFFARATVYQQNIDNFIDVEYSGGTVWGYWRNVGDAKVEGYEVEVGVNYSDFSASLGVWDAKNTLNGEPLVDGNMGLGTSIGRTWLAKLDYYADPAFNLGSSVRLVEREENDIAADAPDKKTYIVAKVYANWNPIEKLTLSVAVNNLFNKFYYDHATYTYTAGSYAGYPSLGRELVTSVAYRF